MDYLALEWKRSEISEPKTEVTTLVITTTRVKEGAYQIKAEVEVEVEGDKAKEEKKINKSCVKGLGVGVLRAPPVAGAAKRVLTIT